MILGYQSGKVAIVGWHEGGAGQMHALLTAEGGEVACFINENQTPPAISNPPKRAAVFSYPTETTFKGLPLITENDWVGWLLEHDIENVLIFAPDNAVRQRMFAAAEKRINILGYIHPSAVVFPDAVLGVGVVMLANTLLGYRAQAHHGVIVNNGAQIDHNSVVHPCASISPGAILCGSVEVGERTMVGAGATIINRAVIGADCVIGAGSLVRKNVAPGTCVVGVPARVLRRLELESET